MDEEITEINQDENCCDFASFLDDMVAQVKSNERFVPTHQELMVLAKHWISGLLHICFGFGYMYPRAESCIQKAVGFAWERLNTITRMVGNEEANKAWEKGCNDSRNGVGDDLFWIVVKHGHESLRDVFAKEMNSDIRRDKKRLDSYTYVAFSECLSPDSAKRNDVGLTRRESADLDAALFKFAKSVEGILGRGSALIIRAKSEKKESIQ